MEFIVAGLHFLIQMATEFWIAVNQTILLMMNLIVVGVSLAVIFSLGLVKVVIKIKHCYLNPLAASLIFPLVFTAIIYSRAFYNGN